MIEIIEDLTGSAVGFTATGKVSGKDYETVLVPAVEECLANNTKVRLLYHLGPGFEGFEPAAVWDDAKVGLRHLTRWERVAVVTDIGWIGASVRAFGFVMPAEVRVFPHAELDDAKAWLAE